MLAQWLQVYLFFTFFLSPTSVSFAEKVNPRWLQLNLFVVAPTCHHNLVCRESLLIFWRQDNSPSATISTTMSSPPPSAPGGGGDPGHSGRRGKLYLATQAACAAAAQRKEAHANVLLSRLNLAAPPSPPLNRTTR